MAAASLAAFSAAAAAFAAASFAAMASASLSLAACLAFATATATVAVAASAAAFLKVVSEVAIKSSACSFAFLASATAAAARSSSTSNGGVGERVVLEGVASLGRVGVGGRVSFGVVRSLGSSSVVLRTVGSSRLAVVLEAWLRVALRSSSLDSVSVDSEGVGARCLLFSLGGKLFRLFPHGCSCKAGEVGFGGSKLRVGGNTFLVKVRGSGSESHSDCGGEDTVDQLGDK